MLEAVWFKNGKEIDWIDPVEDVEYGEDMTDITKIRVFNGYHWYDSSDCFEEPDDFVIRVKVEED